MEYKNKVILNRLLTESVQKDADDGMAEATNIIRGLPRNFIKQNYLYISNIVLTNNYELPFFKITDNFDEQLLIIRDVILHNFELDANTKKYAPACIRFYLNVADESSLRLIASYLMKVLPIIGDPNSKLRDEYDSDLNGLDFNSFMAQTEDIVNERLNQERNKVDKMEFNDNTSSDYDIIPINSFSAMAQFGKPYTDWCIALQKGQWQGEMEEEPNRKCFVLAKDGFEDIPRKETDGFPKDEYGTSLICIILDMIDGNITLRKSTSRWNYKILPDNEFNELSKNAQSRAAANGKADYMFSPSEISTFINSNMFTYFKRYFNYNENKKNDIDKIISETIKKYIK